MDHPAFPTVVARIAKVCQFAGPPNLLSDLRQQFQDTGLAAAVARHDTPALFDWLMRVLSLQGVSDAVAWSYMDRHGSVRFSDIAAGLAASPACPKLSSYWQFAECHFAKGDCTCNRPEFIAACPLPTHDLRNGRLNQTAYSLFLFLRDVCGGDLVNWIDERLTGAAAAGDLDHPSAVRNALLDPLGCIYGISSKVLSMALADLLLAGDPGRLHWVAAGAAMIAIDSLVHNWLHRTGSLQELDAAHPYGPRCYGPGGCAAIVEAAAHRIDARSICADGPASSAVAAAQHLALLLGARARYLQRPTHRRSSKLREPPLRALPTMSSGPVQT